MSLRAAAEAASVSAADAMSLRRQLASQAQLADMLQRELMRVREEAYQLQGQSAGGRGGGGSGGVQRQVVGAAV